MKNIREVKVLIKFGKLNEKKCQGANQEERQVSCVNKEGIYFKEAVLGRIRERSRVSEIRNLYFIIPCSYHRVDTLFIS